MEDESSLPLDGKTVGNLRVVDLKQELEKRGLSKSGSKKDLVKRLKQQLEFEKLCEDRKLSGDCDLKLELDAATEQNEFVQQYLAQQQKIYAEQREAKRLVELEEVQKYSEQESCDSVTITDECKEKSGETDKTPEPREKYVSENGKKYSDTIVESVESRTAVIEEQDSQSHPVDSEHISSSNESRKVDSSCGEEKSPDMEPATPFPSVPYSLSDIQLPDSPGKTISKSASKSLANDNGESISEKKENVDEGKCDSHSNGVCSVDAALSPNNQTSFSVDLKPESGELDAEEKSSKNVKESGNESPTDHSEDSESDSNSETAQGNKENIKRKSSSFKDFEQEASSGKVSATDMKKHASDLSKEGKKGPCVKSEGSGDQSSDSSGDDHQHENSDKRGRKKHRSGSSVDNRRKCRSKSVSSTECQRKHRNKSITSVDKRRKHRSKSVSSTDSEGKSISIMSPENKRKHRSKSVSSTECKKKRRSKSVSPFESQRKRRSKSISPFESQRKRRSKSISPFESQRKHRSKSISPSESQRKHRSKSISPPESRRKHRSKSISSSDSRRKHRNKAGSPVDNRRKHEGKDVSLAKSRRKRRSKSVDSNNSNSSQSSSSSPRRKRHHEVKKHGNSMPKANKQESSVVLNRPESHTSDVNKQDNSHSESQDISQPEKHLNDKHSDKEKTRAKSPESSPAPRQRLKIKRDNIVKAEIISSSKADSFTENHTSKEEKSTSKQASVPSSASSDTFKQESSKTVEKLLEISYTPRKVSLTNRKLNRSSVEEKKSDESKPKRNKWSSFATIQKNSQSISISTDSLKNWFPDFKLISEPAPANEQGGDDSLHYNREEQNSSAVSTDVPDVDESAVKPGAVLQKDTPELLQTSPVEEEPSEQGPVSRIIFIQNLVRPFTLNQLKELLKQNGDIVEEQFWIDKIKSKCFVMYETEESAMRTKNMLNGARWPSSNPKILAVEFSTEEELEFHKRGSETSKPALESQPTENLETYEIRTVIPIDEHKKKERDHKKERERQKARVPVREWDQDKILQESPEKEHASKDAEKVKSSEKKEKKESKRRSDEDTPAKLLDDLFQKTKSTPCIYWLPLTEEQLQQKEEDKRLRRQEREKRNQQKEEEENDRRNKKSRSDRRSRETENRRSVTRSRSPVPRRR